MIANIVPTTPKAQGWVLLAVLALVAIVFWSMRNNGQIAFKKPVQTTV